MKVVLGFHATSFCTATLGTLCVLGATFSVLGSKARADTLALQDFLNQVKAEHLGYQAALDKSAATLERSEETKLQYAYTLFSEVQHSDDKSIGPNPLTLGLETSTSRAVIGVAKQERFGLQTKLSYYLQRSDFTMDNPLPGRLPPSGAIAGFNLELVQPLWKNGFGQDLQAKEQQADFARQASSLGDKFSAKATLLAAQRAYWRLAAAQELLNIQKDSFARTQKITQWQRERQRKNLSDAADLLQAQAALKLRELDLKSASNEARAALKACNEFRGKAASEALKPVYPASTDVLSLTAPARAQEREDLQAQKLALEAERVGVALTRNQYLPSLDAFANAGLSGADSETMQGAGSAFSTKNPIYAIGLRFNMILDRELLEKTLRAYTHDLQAKESALRQKALDLDHEWLSLEQKLAEAKERLSLVTELEKAQKLKLNAEKERMLQGRSTTYQTFLFEQDFLGSQIARLQATSQVLEILVGMKAYEGVGL